MRDLRPKIYFTPLFWVQKSLKIGHFCRFFRFLTNFDKFLTKKHKFFDKFLQIFDKFLSKKVKFFHFSMKNSKKITFFPIFLSKKCVNLKNLKKHEFCIFVFCDTFFYNSGDSVRRKICQKCANLCFCKMSNLACAKLHLDFFLTHFCNIRGTAIRAKTCFFSTPKMMQK